MIVDFCEVIVTLCILAVVCIVGIAPLRTGVIIGTMFTPTEGVEVAVGMDITIGVVIAPTFAGKEVEVGVVV